MVIKYRIRGYYFKKAKAYYTAEVKFLGIWRKIDSNGKVYLFKNRMCMFDYFSSALLARERHMNIMQRKYEFRLFPNVKTKSKSRLELNNN